MSELNLTGKFIVATPQVVGAPFERAVILLLHHGEDGAHGVILNRPLEAPVSTVLDDWQDHATAPALLFGGGPVGLDTAIGLVHLPGQREDDEEIGLHMILGAVGLVDLDMPPQVIAAELAGMRVYVGYSGWEGGQLEQELVRSDWVIADSEVGDIFTEMPSTLWHDVLRRQESPVSYLITYPDEATLN